MIYSYFEIGLKPAVVSCLANSIAPLQLRQRAVQTLKRIGQSSSPVVVNLFCICAPFQTVRKPVHPCHCTKI